MATMATRSSVEDPLREDPIEISPVQSVIEEQFEEAAMTQVKSAQFTLPSANLLPVRVLVMMPVIFNPKRR